MMITQYACKFPAVQGRGLFLPAEMPPALQPGGGPLHPPLSSTEGHSGVPKVQTVLVQRMGERIF